MKIIIIKIIVIIQLNLKSALRRYVLYYRPKTAFTVCFTVVFGEDIAFGGVFGCTADLKEKYGKVNLLVTVKYIMAI